MATVHDHGDYDAAVSDTNGSNAASNDSPGSEDASPKYAPALSGAWWLLLIAMVAALARWLF